MWVVSLVLFIAGSVLCGASWSVGSLIVFRVLQAIGGGMLMPVGQTMLAAKAGPQRMGRVMSVIAVPAMLGPVLGPVLGGVIVDNLAWRWMFFINVPICVAALLAAFAWLPRDTERVRERAPGHARPRAALPRARRAGLRARPGRQRARRERPRVYGWVAAGAVLTAAFAAHALRRRSEALVDLSLFRDRGFTTSVAAMFLYAGAAFGVMLLSPVYFQTVRGDTPLRAGFLLAPLGIGAMITMPLAGRLTDRIGSRVTGSHRARRRAGRPVGLHPARRRHQQGPARASRCSCIGLGHGTIMPALMAAVYQRLDRSAVPAATTASNILVRVGSSFGVAALAVALQIYIRRAFPSAAGTVASAASVRTPGAPSHLAHAFGNGFWWALAIAAVAVVPIALLPRHRSAASVVEGDGPVAEPVDDRV